jgi:hypothetical protein
MDVPNLFSCVDRFEERDFRFLTSVIADRADADGFRRFVSDRDDLLAMLDERRVLDALLESPALLNVSPSFYFYVLIRHSLIRSGLEDTALAEYLGTILAERVPIGPSHALKGIPNGFVHTVDFLGVLNRATGDTRYELLVAAGNQFLVLTGIFPGYIRQRCERHGGPGIEYYESFARASFHQAREHPQARRLGTREVFDTLSRVLPEARRTLNHVADSLLFLAS